MKTIWLALFFSLVAIIALVFFATKGTVSVDLAVTAVAVIITVWMVWPFDLFNNRRK